MTITPHHDQSLDRKRRRFSDPRLPAILFISLFAAASEPTIGWRASVAGYVGGAIVAGLAFYALTNLHGVNAWLAGVGLLVLAALSFVWAGSHLSFLDGEIMLGCWAATVCGLALWLNRSHLPVHRKRIIWLEGRSDSVSGASGTLDVTFAGRATGTATARPTPWGSVKGRLRRRRWPWKRGS
jgi:hypothetical protein